MKILLIENILNYKYHYSIGLLSLATILKQKGFLSEILNFDYLFAEKILNYDADPEKNFETMAEYIISKNPDVAGFTTICGSFHNTIVLSRLIKKKNSKIKIILGGPHSSVFPEKILEEFEFIDLILTGEGENKIEELVKGLANNDISDVPSIVYRNDGTIIRNKDMDLISDLDTLPLLNYSLIPYFNKFNQVNIETGRGCPYNCIYCSTSVLWKHEFRVKSAERICDEILYTKRFSGNEKISFRFQHDNFAADYDFTMNLCEKLQKLNIEWACCTRINNLDEKLIEQMALAGCRSILTGIESASPGIQKSINKNLNLEKANSIFHIILKNRIDLTVSFIYGFPEETEEDLNLTLNMIYSLAKKGVDCQIHSLAVLGGTKLFDNHRDNLILQDYCSNIADVSNFQFYKSLIGNHRDLFSHFYTLKDSLREKYPLLEKFTDFILIYLCRDFQKTLDLIIERAGNILEFHKDFLINTDNKFREAVSAREYLNIKTFVAAFNNAIDFLKVYINKKSEEPLFQEVRNTFLKEMNLLINIDDIRVFPRSEGFDELVAKLAGEKK